MIGTRMGARCARWVLITAVLASACEGEESDRGFDNSLVEVAESDDFNAMVTTMQFSGREVTGPDAETDNSALDLSEVTRPVARLLRRGESLITADLESLSINELRAEVVAIAEANIARRDNLDDVLERLLPRVTLLAIEFANRRPDDELALTAQPWKTVWDNVVIPDVEIATLDRQRSFQIVEDGFYYNVTNLRLGGRPVQYFLKGLYTIAKPPSDFAPGVVGLNVIELEFAESVLLRGPLPETEPLVGLVADVEAFVSADEPIDDAQPFVFRGPQGQTGELYNLYVDDDVRVTIGLGQSPLLPPVLAVFRKVVTAGD